MFQGINAIEFGKRFYDNESCYLYLMELKWGKGFLCSRCGHDKHYKGKTYYYRKCRKCGYSESVTANTVFRNEDADSEGFSHDIQINGQEKRDVNN